MNRLYLDVKTGPKEVNGSHRGDSLLLKSTGILNRDKTLARSNQPRTSETYRRQDDVFGYEL